MSHRRPRDSAATRASLLKAARIAFTKYGYEGAGVREIAESAQADKALIARYFGSKENLFAEAIPETFTISFLIDGDRDKFGERVVRHLLDHGRRENFDPTIALLRSVADPNAVKLLRDGIEKNLISPLADWLQGENAELQSAMIVAQIAGLELMLNVLSLSSFVLSDKEMLIEKLSSSIQNLVDRHS